MATAKKRGKGRPSTAPADWKQTSLRIDPAVYRRAWDYKLDEGKDLGVQVSEALDKYLKDLGR